MIFFKYFNKYFEWLTGWLISNSFKAYGLYIMYLPPHLTLIVASLLILSQIHLSFGTLLSMFLKYSYTSNYSSLKELYLLTACHSKDFLPFCVPTIRNFSICKQPLWAICCQHHSYSFDIICGHLTWSFSSIKYCFMNTSYSLFFMFYSQ